MQKDSISDRVTRPHGETQLFRSSVIPAVPYHIRHELSVSPACTMLDRQDYRESSVCATVETSR